MIRPYMHLFYFMLIVMFVGNGAISIIATLTGKLSQQLFDYQVSLLVAGLLYECVVNVGYMVANRNVSKEKEILDGYTRTNITKSGGGSSSYD